MLESLETLFTEVSDKLKGKGPEEWAFVDEKKLSFTKLKEEFQALQTCNEDEIAEVVMRTRMIIKKTNSLMKGLKKWMEGRKDLQKAFLEAVKNKAIDLGFKSYEGNAADRGKKRIHLSWESFIHIIMYDVIPLARSLNYLPILCKPCFLVFTCSRKKFNPKMMIDLSKIFRTSSTIDLEAVKLNFSRALFNDDNDELEKEELLKKFNKLKMPQITLPGEEFSNAKYHPCLKGSGKTIKDLEPEKDLDRENEKYGLRKNIKKSQTFIPKPATQQERGQGPNQSGKGKNSPQSNT
jgi:hypothetical protein